MRRPWHRSTRLVAVLVGVVVLGATASGSLADSPGSAGSVAFVKPATRSVQPRLVTVPAAHPSAVVAPTPEELQDLAGLAGSKGMSFEEAVAEYGWRDEFGRVADDLAYAHPSSYVEAAIEDGDGYGARISFASDAPADAAAKLAAAGLPVPVLIRDRMGWNQADVVEVAQRVFYTVADDPTLSSNAQAGPGTATGEIEILVKPPAGVSVAEAQARIRDAATSDGPLKSALDLAPPTVSVVIAIDTTIAAGLN